MLDKLFFLSFDFIIHMKSEKNISREMVFKSGHVHEQHNKIDNIIYKFKYMMIRIDSSIAL